MSHVLLHLLILYALVAVVLVGVLIAKRAGVRFEGLKYAGIFGFIGASFGVVIGMTTFFASEHYANMRDTAQKEASAMGVVDVMTGSFPPREGKLIRIQLYCSATEIIDHEWTVTNGQGSPEVTRRESYGYVLLLKVGQDPPKPENWYSQATSSGIEAGTARQERLLLAEARIPAILWFLLYVGAGLIVLFAFFFHLSSRPQLAGMLIAVILMLSAVTAVLVALDYPTESPFGLEPTAIQHEQALIGPDVGVGDQSPSAFCAEHPVPKSVPLRVE
ncbi:MAG: bestrophin-like domain [Candidatus Limnocylindria bacterium]